MQKRIISPFWMVSASIALSLAWVLPNHSQPWMGFHGDAWAASMLVVTSFFVLRNAKFLVEWHWLVIVSVAMSVIPLVQYVTGMVLFWGVAWINMAYMLGFSLALLVGAAWEKETSGQCLDYLLLSIGVASVVSVGLQLHQFLDLEPIGPWILLSPSSRYSANMAQPNQLASLLLLGLLGCAWAHFRKLLGACTAIGIAALLLVGLALTGSRTGWLNILMLVMVTLIWHRLAPTKRYPWVVLGLAGFFVICIFGLPLVSDFFRGGLPPDQYRSVLGDARWTAWVMFLKAAIQRPILGFGWGQLAHAQFLMLDERIALGGSFLQAHNLFIDLILWNGWPIGLIIGVFLVLWCWTVVRRVRTYPQLICMCFLMVLGTHSMLEYPLQYAYFLLPTGLVMGCLNVSVGFGTALGAKKWLTAAMLTLSIVVLAITIRDYFRVETSFYGLRFEQRKIKTSIPRTPPDVLALTQWHDYIAFARIEPRVGMTSAEMDWMRGLVSTVPSAFGMYRFAAMLVLNDQTDEAKLWLKRVCLTSPIEQCEVIKEEWARQSLISPKIAAVPWPEQPN